MILKQKFGYLLIMTTLIVLMTDNPARSAEMKPKSTDEENMDRLYCVHSGTTATYMDGILKIGLGKVDFEKYVDEQGAEHEGYWAFLYLWKKGDFNRPKETVKVHKGQTISFEDYMVRVTDIDWKMHSNRKIYCISLEIKPNEK